MRTLTIRSIVFTPRSNNQQQYVRPFVSNFTNEAAASVTKLHIRELTKKLAMQEGVPYEEEEMIVSSLVGFSHNATPVPFPSHDGKGWESEVHSFVMDCIESVFGTPRTFIAAGYTDRPIFKENQVIDLDAKLVINAIYSYQGHKTLDQPVFYSANQVLSNRNVKSSGDLKQQLMRPSNVFSAIARMEFMQDLTGEVIDVRSSYVYPPVFSNYSNNEPSNYVDKVATSYWQGKHACETLHRENRLWEEANAMARDDSVARNFLMHAISRATGEVTNVIDLNGLKIFDTDVMSKVQVVVKEPSHATEFEYRSWDNSDPATMAANHMVQSIPALMAKHGVTKIDLSYENQNIDGFLQGSPYMSKEDADSLMLEIRHRVFDVVTKDNAQGFNFTGTFDLFGESSVSFMLDDLGGFHYKSPTFANALFSPMIAQDMGQLDKVASDFKQALLM